MLHKAQRETNADGAIVATLDDYYHAHAAFDEGLASVHGYADAKVIAVVEAIEAMQSRGLMPDRGEGDTARSRQAAARRLADDRRRAPGGGLDCGAIEQDDTMGGRGGARYYRVLETSEALRKRPKSRRLSTEGMGRERAAMDTPRDRADKPNKKNERPKKTGGKTQERRI